jgi:hypothetical protein
MRRLAWASVRECHPRGNSSPAAAVRRELDRSLDDAVGHPAVSAAEASPRVERGCGIVPGMHQRMARPKPLLLGASLRRGDTDPPWSRPTAYDPCVERVVVTAKLKLGSHEAAAELLRSGLRSILPRSGSLGTAPI